MKTRKLWTAGAAVALTALMGLVLGGCSGGGTGASGGKTDSGGKITVWVDPPRVPAADAFKKAYPDIPISVQQIDGTVGGKTVQQQFAQFDAAKKGWPDAIFFPSNDDIAWATSAKSRYAADLSAEMPELVKGYDPAVLAPCEIGGKYYCARNDAAPDVFWYNAAFFAQKGYTVPKTWEEYGQLAVRIAQENPGWVSGFTGDAYAPDRYLWGSNCPTNDTVSATKVRIDLSAPTCVRAKKLLSSMYQGKALSTVGIFDADAAKIGPQLAMSPGAVWWGDYLFNQTWKIAPGTMTAVAPLTWQGESKPTTGDEGGGLWALSSHITGKQLKNAKVFMKFVASDPAWQVELSTGLPAYGAVQSDWIKKQSASNYYADTSTTFAAFKSAISRVPTAHKYQLYNTGSVWTETMAPALVSGKPFDDAWNAFGKDLVDQAKAQGYTVVTSK